MTASEPLSLDEEYAMQQSWRQDSNKCTFIILAKGSDDTQSSYTDTDAIDRMAGDVNLFFNDDEDATNCEIEIMIAEAKYRRKGFAREALQLMMAFATSQLRVSRFYCKIHETNEASLTLFRSLDYTQCNYVKAFQEIELERTTSDHYSTLVDQVFRWAHLQRLENKALSQ